MISSRSGSATALQRAAKGPLVSAWLIRFEALKGASMFTGRFLFWGSVSILAVYRRLVQSILMFFYIENLLYFQLSGNIDFKSKNAGSGNLG
jgi:hypothetical protein